MKPDERKSLSSRSRHEVDAPAGQPETSIALIKGDAVKYKAEKAEGGANQILLDPIVITKENVDFLVKDGFYTKEQLGL